MKSMIAQIREEFETFLVGWNLSGEKSLRVIEHPDPYSPRYIFKLGYAEKVSYQLQDISFTYMRDNGNFYLTCDSDLLERENMEWLVDRFRIQSSKISYKRYFRNTNEDENNIEYQFVLNKPQDIYDILIKTRPRIKAINPPFRLWK